MWKTFSQKGSLYVHERYHTGGKPCECNHAGISFIQKSGLIHQRLHTEEKPFTCKHYEKAFQNKLLLSQHEKNTFCRKSFSVLIVKKCSDIKKKITVHLKIHTGKKL